MTQLDLGTGQCAADHSHQIPIYVFMVLYFILIVSVGVVATFRKRAATQKLGEVKGHFAGEFSMPMMVLTTCSSVFSGYTVMGIPQDAYQAGFIALRWLPSVMMIAAGMMTLYPRLRRLALTRNYMGPNDFIADRYRHKGLTILASIGVCLPQVLYLTVQLVSFAGLLSSLTLECIPKWAGMLIFSVLALVLEKSGGMNSVVLSDSVQSVLMVLGFLILSIILASRFGTLGAIYNEDCVPDYINVTHKSAMIRSGNLLDSPLACVFEGNETSHPDCAPHGCAFGQSVTRWIPANQDHAAFPAYSAIPPVASISAFFWNVANYVMFPLNPFMVQRAVLAPSDQALKVVMITLTLAPFLTTLLNMYAGIVYGTNSLSFTGQTVVGGQAAPGINSHLLEDGNSFDYIIVGLVVCSSLAAIMSTADSVILGVANELSISVYQGVLNPDATPQNIVFCATTVSILLVAASCTAGLFIEPGQFSALSRIQNGIIFQTAPSFFVGLYGSKPASKAMITGMVVGLIASPAVYGIEAIGEAFGLDWMSTFFTFLPGVSIAAILNFITVAVLYRGDVEKVSGENFPEAEKRFGEPLTADDIEEAMARDKVPSLALCIFTCCVVLLPVPYFADRLGSAPVAGFPMWAFVVVVLCAVSALMSTITICLWEPQRDVETVETLVELGTESVASVKSVEPGIELQDKE